MNTSLAKQIDTLNILDEQDRKNIQNLLRKKKKFKKEKSTDPVYNQLFVIHEQNKQIIRSKTYRDSQSQFSIVKTHPRQKGTETDTRKHKRSFTSSYSVQLPPLSKRFQSHHSSQAKNESYQKIFPSNFTGKKSSPHELRSVTQERQTQFPEIKVIDHKRRYQTIGNQPVKPQPKSSAPFTTKPKPLKAKIQYNSNKHAQWKQIDLLKLQTYFIKLKRTKNSIFSTSRINNMHQYSQTKNMIPSDQTKIPDFIKSYKATNSDIMIDNLIKSTKFGVIYEEGLCLYFGQVQNKCKSGYGVLVCNNYRFEGLFRNDEKVIGYQITMNGYYRGRFTNGKREGTGEYIWYNGESYSGEWKNGVKSGSGVWKSGKGDSYIGQWSNGKVQGSGVHLTATGQRYQGNFVQFLKSGKGVESFPNGDTYVGEYLKGQANGKGRYTWKNGLIFQGYFKNGYRHGKGKLIAKDYLKFEGIFEKDLPNGQGQLIYENGDHYIGNFYNGEKNGQGTMRLRAQQKVLTGLWQRNKFQFQQQQQA